MSSGLLPRQHIGVRAIDALLVDAVVAVERRRLRKCGPVVASKAEVLRSGQAWVFTGCQAWVFTGRQAWVFTSRQAWIVQATALSTSSGWSVRTPMRITRIDSAWVFARETWIGFALLKSRILALLQTWILPVQAWIFPAQVLMLLQPGVFAPCWQPWIITWWHARIGCARSPWVWLFLLVVPLLLLCLGQ